MSSSYDRSHRYPRPSHLRQTRRPQHVLKNQPTSVSIMFLVEDPQTDSDPETPSKGAKVTQRMLQLREMIADGSYPDKDELAVRIVDKL